MDYEKIKSDILEKIENKSIKLPRLPDVVIRINQILEDEEKGMDDIARVIQSDLALSARLLQIANSPALRGVREIKSIKDTISVLGINLIKDYSLSIAIRDQFRSSNSRLKAILNDVWEESVKEGVYGFVLTQNIETKLKPETSLLVGLLHNIGSLPIIDYVSTHPELSALDDVEIKGLIVKLNGFVGEKVLTTWGFSPEMIISILMWNSTGATEIMTYGDVLKLITTYLDYEANQLEDSEICSHLMSDVDTIIKNSQDDISNLSILLDK